MILKIDDALVNTLEIKLLPDYHDKVKELFFRYTQKVNNDELCTQPIWDLGRSAKLLMQKVLPETKWAVQYLIPEGSTLLCGKPKAGKSFMALQMACRVNEGKTFLGRKTRKGKVLYITLEDEENRIQKRLKYMGYDSSGLGLENLYLEYTSTWKRFYKKNVIKIITEYLKYWDGEVSLVIIDTLQRFRGLQEESSNMYGADYAFMNEIQEMASATNTAIVNVHHTKKSATGDFVADGAGSFGIVGGSDNVYCLYREDNEAHGILKGGGRDVVGVQQWLYFDEEFCSFFAITEEMVPEATKQMLAGSKEKETKNVKPVELCVFEILSKKYKVGFDELLAEVCCIRSDIAESTVKRNLTKMISEGYLHADGKGDKRPIYIKTK